MPYFLIKHICNSTTKLRVKRIDVNFSQYFFIDYFEFNIFSNGLESTVPTQVGNTRKRKFIDIFAINLPYGKIKK